MAIGFQRVPKNDMSDLVKPGLVGMLGQRTDRNATSYRIALHIAVHEIEVLQRDIQCRQSRFGIPLWRFDGLDVVFAFGLRQAELVTRLHRAKLAIAESLGNR